MADEVNKIGLRNTRATFTEEPACRDGYANGTRPVEGGHSGRADPKYEHWCRPEPRGEFPWELSDLERAEEKQGGIQEDTQGLTGAEGGAIGGWPKLLWTPGPGLAETLARTAGRKRLCAAH